MKYIIGSGPAGVACAKALLERNERVIMLDAGIALDSNRQAIIDKMSKQPFAEWSKDDIELLKENSAPTTDGLPKKYVYGSDYTYQGVEKHFPMEAKDCTCQPTFAQGGLTTAWGAAIMPYSQEDIEAWPITIEDLDLYYKKVFSFVPLATREDLLAEKFPLYAKKITKLNISKQAMHLLSNLDVNRNHLANDGIYSCHARLAVAAEPACVSCGMCMYGCPYQIIYNAAYTLAELQSQPKFTYQSDVIVDKIEEKSRYVIIHAHKMSTGEALSFQAEQVFIGAGAFASTKIMLQTLGWEDKPVVMKDSQSFLLPMLLTKQIMKVSKERLHTLPQVFLEVYHEYSEEKDKNDTDKNLNITKKHPVHIQVYTYNELYKRALETKLGSIAKIFKMPLDAVLGRIVISMGFLHSDLSPSINVTLHEGKLLLEKIPNPKGNEIVDATVQMLKKNASRIGARPVKKMLKHAMTGKSYHYGGTFPMSNNPKENESDILGRPCGLKRTYLIDSATFPSIPATTISLTIMANAYRIGAEYDKFEKVYRRDAL